MNATFSRGLIAIICLSAAGCTAAATKPLYVSLSEGLPTAEQWKCNPAFGDVNQDGLLDLAAVARKGPGARVWLNGGAAGWSESSEGIRARESTGGAVALGDLNGDGDLDLLVGDHSQGLFVYLGDGRGAWTAAESGLPAMQADDIALADLNRDGHLDLCAGSAADQGIALFFGNGDGTFQEAADAGFPAEESCHDVVLADINHDGVPDVAATMMAQPRAWLSTPAGAWVEASDGLPVHSSGGDFWGIDAGDVNGDGEIDLVVANIRGTPEIYLGDGRGTWRAAPSPELAVLQSTWGVALGDLDGDGFLDVVASGKKKRDVRGNAFGVFLFRGNGAGAFEHVEDSGVPDDGLFQSWGLALADLDGNGTLEIAGCFGIGHSEEPPPFLATPEEIDKLFEGRERGPGGSVRVWGSAPESAP